MGALKIHARSATKTKAANALNQSTGFLGRKKKLIMENRSLENEHD
ncbi:hypothetical protein [Pseudomonas sp. R3-41]|jgi:hypothetical protein